MATLDERIEAYKTDGFTIFEKVFDETQMELGKRSTKNFLQRTTGKHGLVTHLN